MDPNDGFKKSPSKRRVIASHGLFGKAVASVTSTARPSSSRASSAGMYHFCTHLDASVLQIIEK